MRPQDKRSDPIIDLPIAASSYQSNFGRMPFGLPDTGNIAYSSVQRRGKGAEVLPSQKAMLATSKGPLRAQQPYLRPSMRANGEISRKAHDPEFKVNQAAFYAATPDSTAVFNKDRGAFYRGSTPR